MTREDIDRIATEYLNDTESEFEMQEVIELADKALILEKAIEDIKAEIGERIAYWDKRKPDMNETKIDYTRTTENSVPIRNPREIEYIRYDNRVEGLDEALDIINNHIGDTE